MRLKLFTLLMMFTALLMTGCSNRQPVIKIDEKILFVIRESNGSEIRRGIVLNGDQRWNELVGILTLDKTIWQPSIASYVAPILQLSANGIEFKLYDTKVVIDLTEMGVVRSWERPDSESKKLIVKLLGIGLK
jgi:hypothetical protein